LRGIVLLLLAFLCEGIPLKTFLKLLLFLDGQFLLMLLPLLFVHSLLLDLLVTGSTRTVACCLLLLRDLRCSAFLFDLLLLLLLLWCVSFLILKLVGDVLVLFGHCLGEHFRGGCLNENHISQVDGVGHPFLAVCEGFSAHLDEVGLVELDLALVLIVDDQQLLPELQTDAVAKRVGTLRKLELLAFGVP
jgi:hypothetical protein